MAYELKDFDRDVIARSHELPVLVDFWAPWCGPCKMLGPVLEELAGKEADGEGRWAFVKVNTEDHPKIALDHQISGIPDVRLFRNGEAVADFKGFMSAEAIEEWLKDHLPSVHEDEILTARAAAEEGEMTKALDQIRALIEREPDREALRIEAAGWALRTEPIRCEELLASIGEDSDHHEAAAALRVLADFLADGDASGKESAKEAFKRGCEALRAGNEEEWIDAWLEAIERDREFAGGKLIEAYKAAFRRLGPRHPVSEKFYRRFTSTLY